MKAEELMVGDYVQVSSTQKAVKIAAVHHKKIGYHVYEYKLSWVRQGLLCPIPLTPEILNKNGFIPLEEDSYIYKQLNSDKSDVDFSIVVDLLVPYLSHIEKHSMPKSRCSGEIRYVHDLQQALRQCKIKKEIVL